MPMVGEAKRRSNPTFVELLRRGLGGGTENFRSHLFEPAHSWSLILLVVLNGSRSDRTQGRSGAEMRVNSWRAPRYPGVDVLGLRKSVVLHQLQRGVLLHGPEGLADGAGTDPALIDFQEVLLSSMNLELESQLGQHGPRRKYTSALPLGGSGAGEKLGPTVMQPEPPSGKAL